MAAVVDANDSYEACKLTLSSYGVDSRLQYSLDEWWQNSMQRTRPEMRKYGNTIVPVRLLRSTESIPSRVKAHKSYPSQLPTIRPMSVADVRKASCDAFDDALPSTISVAPSGHFRVSRCETQSVSSVSLTCLPDGIRCGRSISSVASMDDMWLCMPSPEGTLQSPFASMDSRHSKNSEKRKARTVSRQSQRRPTKRKSGKTTEPNARNPQAQPACPQRESIEDLLNTVQSAINDAATAASNVQSAIDKVATRSELAARCAEEIADVSSSLLRSRIEAPTQTEEPSTAEVSSYKQKSVHKVSLQNSKSAPVKFSNTVNYVESNTKEKWNSVLSMIKLATSLGESFSWIHKAAEEFKYWLPPHGQEIGVISVDDFVKHCYTELKASPEDEQLMQAAIDCAFRGAKTTGFQGWLRWYASYAFIDSFAAISEQEGECRKISRDLCVDLAEVHKLYADFTRFDTDGSGLIEEDEFSAVLAWILKVSEKDIPHDRLRRAWLQADSDQSCALTFQAFVVWCQKYMGKSFDDDVEAERKSAPNFFRQRSRAVDYLSWGGAT